MSLRLQRRINLLPGVTLNLSKTGPSLSFHAGPISFNTRRNRLTVDLPGSGIYYVNYLGSGSDSDKKTAKKDDTSGAEGAPANSPLRLNLIERFTVPEKELSFVDALSAIEAGDDAKAMRQLPDPLERADLLFIRGSLHIKEGRLEDALRDFEAFQTCDDAGQLFQKYGVSYGFSLPITEEITAFIRPEHHDVAVTIAELHERLGRDTRPLLEKILERYPDDLMARASLAELLLAHATHHDKAALDHVVLLGKDLENDSLLHAALLYYKAQALRRLGLLTAAQDILTKAIRRTKDRPKSLLHALRYERILLYEELGEEKKAQTEAEKLYAEAPDFADLRARVGLVT